MQDFSMKILPFAGFLLFAGSASATSLSVPQIQVNRIITANYRCPDGKQFSVTYLNADNGQSFAIVPYRGKPMFLVSTMSADGVKYQADSVTWWNKGRGGMLFDARIDEEKPILDGCASKG
jgi:membrane-bound inhibitor of C-type lysozyme